jgi:hypothetical protein
VSEPGRPKLDLDRVTRFLAVAGTTEHEGEAVNAIRMVDRMLRAAGMRWPDLTDGHHRAEVATEAARVQLAENDELRAENERLRAEKSRGDAVAIWQDVGAQISSTRSAAQWALDLHRDGIVWLSPDFEVPFLTRCTTWTGRFSLKMQPIFQRIMDHVVELSGLVPPR